MDYRDNMAVYILSGKEMPLDNPKAERMPSKSSVGGAEVKK